MSNYIRNKITFIGNKEELNTAVNALFDFNEDGTVKNDSIFSKFYPIPAETVALSLLNDTSLSCILSAWAEKNLPDVKSPEFTRFIKRINEYNELIGGQPKISFLSKPWAETKKNNAAHITGTLKNAVNEWELWLKQATSISDLQERINKIELDHLPSFSPKVWAQQLFFAYGLQWTSIIKSYDDLEKIAVDSLYNLREMNSYYWCAHHWGVKCDYNDFDLTNISSAKESEVCIYKKLNMPSGKLYSMHMCFDTANKPPRGFFEKFCEHFPNIVLYWKYADEDYGSNCNELILNNEDCIEKFKTKERTEETFVFACSVWDSDPEEIRELYNEDLE